jgi:heme oxygenase (biliverdin-IX-beta and delta-forming)
LDATSFLQQLRSQTARSHQLIEQNVSSQLLMSKHVTITHYAHYLKSLYGFVYGFEKMAFPLLKDYEVLQLDDRRKSHLIQADLTMLHHTAAEPYLNEELFNTHYQTTAAVLGGMYVLEGSTLGGQIINKHLATVLGHAIAGKTTYLMAYAEKTGSMWKIFLQLLGEAGTTIDNRDEIIDSAVHTFALLNTCLEIKYQFTEYEN